MVSKQNRSLPLNVVKLNRTIFTQYLSSFNPNDGVRVIMAFLTYDLSQGSGTTKTFLTNKTIALRTMLQTTYSLCTKDSLRLVNHLQLLDLLS